MRIVLSRYAEHAYSALLLSPKRSLNAGCRPWPARGGQGPGLCYAWPMNPIVLLEPLTWLRHDPDQGFSDSPQAFIYKGSSTVVRFDKATGTVTLDPPGADLLTVFKELQALAQAQHDQDKARILARLRQRPFQA